MCLKMKNVKKWKKNSKKIVNKKIWLKNKDHMGTTKQNQPITKTKNSNVKITKEQQNNKA